MPSLSTGLILITVLIHSVFPRGFATETGDLLFFCCTYKKKNQTDVQLYYVSSDISNVLQLCCKE